MNYPAGTIQEANFRSLYLAQAFEFVFLCVGKIWHLLGANLKKLSTLKGL
jgi:hypothetical protein